MMATKEGVPAAPTSTSSPSAGLRPSCQAPEGAKPAPAGVPAQSDSKSATSTSNMRGSVRAGLALRHLLPGCPPSEQEVPLWPALVAPEGGCCTPAVPAAAGVEAGGMAARAAATAAVVGVGTPLACGRCTCNPRWLCSGASCGPAAPTVWNTDAREKPADAAADGPAWPAVHKGWLAGHASSAVSSAVGQLLVGRRGRPGLSSIRTTPAPTLPSSPHLLVWCPNAVAVGRVGRLPCCDHSCCDPARPAHPAGDDVGRCCGQPAPS